MLNTLTMKLMGFAIGDPVVVCHKWICKAWPDESISAMNAGISDDFRNVTGIEVGHAVVVYHLSDLDNKAKELHLAHRYAFDCYLSCHCIVGLTILSIFVEFICVRRKGQCN